MDEVADAVLFTIGKVLSLDTSVQQVVARLIRVDEGCLPRLRHLFGIEIGDANVAGLSLLPEAGHGFHTFVDRISRVPGMDLVEVNAVPPEACANSLPWLRRLPVVRNRC